MNALVSKLRERQGRARRSWSSSTRAACQNPPFSNAGTYPAFPAGFADVNGCDHPSGDIVPIVEALDPRVDVVISAHTHQPYVCADFDNDAQSAVTSASSFGRLVTEIDLTIDDQTRTPRKIATTRRQADGNVDRRRPTTRRRPGRQGSC